MPDHTSLACVVAVHNPTSTTCGFLTHHSSLPSLANITLFCCPQCPLEVARVVGLRRVGRAQPVAPRELGAADGQADEAWGGGVPAVVEGVEKCPNWPGRPRGRRSSRRWRDRCSRRWWQAGRRSSVSQRVRASCNVVSQCGDGRVGELTR